MKRGYTLIEIIIVMAILSILCSAGVTIASNIKKQIDYIKIKGVLCDISQGLSYIKYYCRYNEVSGEIAIKKSNSEIKFYSLSNERKILKQIILPKEISFLGDLKLSVSNTGNIESETIRIKSSDTTYRITISTAIDTINIYEGD